jgi:hypothetical protein
MRKERQRDRRPLFCMCFLYKLPDQVLVSAVHSVKHADGYGRGLLQMNIVQAGSMNHARLLFSGEPSNAER